jgi:mono/diheme cytochrome c family protein
LRQEAVFVIPFFRTHRVWRLALGAVPVMVLGFVLAGCDSDNYSSDHRYPPRTDPIFKEVPTKERTTPDAPGQFPVMSMATLANPENPLNEFFQEQRKREDDARSKQQKLQAEGWKIIDPALVPADRRAALDAGLEKMFGTPRQPRVDLAGFKPPDEDDEKDAPPAVAAAVKVLELDPSILGRGARLYRINCLHCHGLGGDGRGPTAPWVNPHPRDFRLGLFKFITTSYTSNDQKPRRQDIIRTITQGLDGSAMPAFNVLPESDIEAMASYVIHLSLRGDVEGGTLYDLFKEEIERKEGEASKTKIEGLMATRLYYSTIAWTKSKDELAPVPAPANLSELEMAASVRRGQQFFLKNGCIGCHIDYGRKSNFRFDKWATLAKPNDLTANIYRGGRRPFDFYCRAKLGIGSCGMPGVAENLDSGLWDLVNFLQALPYRTMREQYGVSID